MAKLRKFNIPAKTLKLDEVVPHLFSEEVRYGFMKRKVKVSLKRVPEDEEEPGNYMGRPVFLAQHQHYHIYVDAVKSGRLDFYLRKMLIHETSGHIRLKRTDGETIEEEFGLVMNDGLLQRLLPREAQIRIRDSRLKLKRVDNKRNPNAEYFEPGNASVEKKSVVRSVCLGRNGRGSDKGRGYFTVNYQEVDFKDGVVLAPCSFEWAVKVNGKMYHSGM